MIRCGDIGEVPPTPPQSSDPQIGRGHDRRLTWACLAATTGSMRDLTEWKGHWVFLPFSTERKSDANCEIDAVKAYKSRKIQQEAIVLLSLSLSLLWRYPGGGTPLWKSFRHVLLYGRVFALFWFKNGYRFCPLWSRIGYGLRRNYGCVSMCSSFQFQMSKKESVIHANSKWISRNLFVAVLISAMMT